MSSLWVSIVAVTLASAAIKAAGPILAGAESFPHGRPQCWGCSRPLCLPPW